MRRFVRSLLFLAVLATGLPLSAQTAVGPCKMDGTDCAAGGGGSGTGWTYDAGEGAWIYTPASGNSDTRILSDGISLQDAAGVDIMAMDATLGATTYVAGRLAADAIEVRGSSSLAASGTITATNVTCSTGGGAVVGTLNATAGNVGRFVYVTRDGANTCTIGVASGQTLDGVTDGTTTVPSAGWKTFVQTSATAWVTAGSYPVTGTLSGLTAPKIPVAASATTVADSDLSYYVGKWHSGEPVNGRKLCFTDSGGDVTCFATMAPGYISQGFAVTRAAAEGSGLGDMYLRTLRASDVIAQGGRVFVGEVILYDSGYTSPAVQLATGARISWPQGTPDAQIGHSAAGMVDIYGASNTYGQLNVGTIQLVDTGTKPTCDAAHRGQVWYDAGGAGVADTYEICRKDAADAYAWTALY